MSDPSKKPLLSVLTSVYRGATYIPSFQSNLIEQSIFPDIEIIFVLNQPDNEEKSLVDAFQSRFPRQVKRIEVPQVETIGSSWNRALEIAQGDFLAVWNVDDAREPHSLAIQIDFLNRYPDCSMAYGDYLLVPFLGSHQGIRKHTPKFNRFQFSRSLPQGGAFLVWRRSLQSALGGFDEQLQAAPDFDFSIRAVLNGFRMCRVPGILGYFLNEGVGLSTRDGSHRTRIEAALIHLRYGIFDKIRPQYLSEVQEYRPEELLVYGRWQSLSSLYHWYDQHIFSRQYLWKVSKVRHIVVSILQRLRLYDLFNFVRERIFHFDV